MSKNYIYTDEFLINEVLRFKKENNKNPIRDDMQGKFGYPNYSTYKNRFGSWNETLKIAGLKLNQEQRKGKIKLTGEEVCDKCGKKPKNQFRYKDGQRICDNCYYDTKYITGNLDPESTTGFAFISQRVVAKTLELDLEYDCNCSIGFTAPYDLYDKNKYGKIDVKTSKYNIYTFNNKSWRYRFNNKNIPDTYILLGFSEGKSNIKHVWITDVLDDLTFKKKAISIHDSYRGLKKAKPWEVDVKPYNDAYHSMSLENCSILRSD